MAAIEELDHRTDSDFKPSLHASASALPAAALHRSNDSVRRVSPALICARLWRQTPAELDQVGVLSPRLRRGKPAGAVGAFNGFGSIPFAVRRVGLTVEILVQLHEAIILSLRDRYTDPLRSPSPIPGANRAQE